MVPHVLNSVVPGAIQVVPLDVRVVVLGIVKLIVQDVR